ncbi:ATP-binding cassette domain-containing protein [Cohnella boryungensis]|uniref:ATP-binding cassette domain-containing protein n=2 Tax=Cohnella boryungensis TaxID=768479 RepID=A0ABV8SCG4_9BACL
MKGDVLMAKVPLVKLAEANRTFAGHRVLNKLSLEIAHGEVVALLGRNGSGKSTLLKALSGLDALDGGTRLSTVPLRRIGFAPDRFPRLRFSAKEYLRAMGKIRGMAPAEADRRIDKLFELFRLETTTDAQLRDYSKGMLQKVNLMQALLEEPELLLLDEPLSGLDAPTRTELTHILLLLKEQGMTIVFSTHERELAARVADRVVQLQDGRVEPMTLEGEENSPNRVIAFRLMDAAAQGFYAAFEGVRQRYEGQGIWICHVQADRADDFLRAVLAANGSILSVREDSTRTNVRGAAYGGKIC